MQSIAYTATSSDGTIETWTDTFRDGSEEARIRAEATAERVKKIWHERGWTVTYEIASL